MHARPAATVSSELSPDDCTRSAPPPARRTPPSAEQSVHIHTASVGSSDRHASAAARRIASGALFSPCPPTSRRNEMRSAVHYGGIVARSQGLNGHVANPAMVRASWPSTRQPVMLTRRTGTRASATSRKRSPAAYLAGAAGLPAQHATSGAPPCLNVK